MAPNAPEMSKYHPFWVMTHFEYFKPRFGVIILLFITLFGAGGSLDPPGAPWYPLAPPCTPWCPHDPWYRVSQKKLSLVKIRGGKYNSGCGKSIRNF